MTDDADLIPVVSAPDRVHPFLELVEDLAVSDPELIDWLNAFAKRPPGPSLDPYQAIPKAMLATCEAPYKAPPPALLAAPDKAPTAPQLSAPPHYGFFFG